MTERRVRWECPTGEHPGVLGPQKPRRDSMVRYCVPCSVASGRLAERVAPAIERQRLAAAERAKAKAKAKRQREARAKQRAREREDARHMVDGVDIRVEFKRLCRLRAFGGSKGRLARRPPKLTVRRYQYMPERLGWASPWRYEVRLNIYRGMDAAEMREILVHELSHIVVGRQRDDGKWHGDEFWALHDKAFREAYGDVPVRFRMNSYVGRYAAGLRAATRKAQA